MELPAIGRVAGWVIAIATGAVIALNGALMLLYPQKWFALPHWLAAKGSLTPKRYARGIGAIQIRLVGAGFLATIAWMLYDMTR